MTDREHTSNSLSPSETANKIRQSLARLSQTHSSLDRLNASSAIRLSNVSAAFREIERRMVEANEVDARRAAADAYQELLASCNTVVLILRFQAMVVGTLTSYLAQVATNAQDRLAQFLTHLQGAEKSDVNSEVVHYIRNLSSAAASERNRNSSLRFPDPLMEIGAAVGYLESLTGILLGLSGDIDLEVERLLDKCKHHGIRVGHV